MYIMHKSSRNLNKKEIEYHKKRQNLIDSVDSTTVAEAPFLFTSYSEITELYTTVRIFDLCNHRNQNLTSFFLHEYNLHILLNPLILAPFVP